MATLIQKARLLQGLLDGDQAATGPFFVVVDLTSRCNIGCLGCQYHSPLVREHRGPPGELALELFEGLCRELRAMGTRMLLLEGTGEPLLHPRAVEMIGLAKAMGFEVMLLTNGTLLDQRRAEALLDARLDDLRISLWAASVEQYQRNYPGVDTRWFRRAVDGARRVIEARGGRALPKVALHHVVNRRNCRDVGSIVDLAQSLGCDSVSFAPMHNAHGELGSFVIDDAEQRAVLLALRRAARRHPALALDERVDQLRLRFKMKSAAEWSQPCYIAWFHVRVYVDGAVRPCGRCDHISFGNLNEEPFEAIWNGPAIRAFRRQMLAATNPVESTAGCRCDHCCYVWDMVAVHRVFRWFRPLRAARASLRARR